MERKCACCSYPNLSCELCPLTVNYWTSLPHGFVISSSGTSSPGVSEARIREIVKEELSAAIDYAKLATIIFNARGSKTDGDAWKPEDFLPKPKTKGLPFSQAFEIIRNDPSKGMRLPQWSSEVVIKVQNPDANSKMTHPYLYVESRKGKVPWRETFPELFSCEWEIVDTSIKIDFFNNGDTGTSTISGHKGPVTSNTVIHNGDFPNTTYTSQ